jgi:hypothetical protein
MLSVFFPTERKRTRAMSGIRQTTIRPGVQVGRRPVAGGSFPDARSPVCFGNDPSAARPVIGSRLPLTRLGAALRAYGVPMDEQHRSCKCGAVYRRTESMANGREVNSFACIYCGEALENWNSAWTPTYRLVVGPTVKPSRINPVSKFP